MLAILACSRDQGRPTVVPNTPTTQDTLPFLAVTQDTAWHLMRDDSVGITWWAPNVTGKEWGFSKQNRRCVSMEEYDTASWNGDDDFSIALVRGPIDLSNRKGIVRDSAGEYHAIGRQGIETSLVTLTGTRWIALFGDRTIGVSANEDGTGGMALGDAPVFIAQIRRADGCFAIIDMGTITQSMSVADVWIMLESFRFQNEDAMRELPNQLLSRAKFDWSDRLMLSIRGQGWATCITSVKPLPTGVPVTVAQPIYGNQQLKRMVIGPAADNCGGVDTTAVNPGRYVYNLQAGYADEDIGLEGVAMVMPARVDVVRDTVVSDINGDGRSEYLDVCQTGNTRTYRLLADDRKTVLWTAQVKATDNYAPNC